MLDSRPLEIPREIQRGQSHRRNLSLRWMFLFIAVAMGGMALVESLLAPSGKSRSGMALAMGCIALLLYLMLRSERGKWHRQLMITSILLATTLTIYSYGSVRASSSFALLGAVVMAGTYLSLRTLLAVTFSTVLILGGLTWAEAGGHLVKADMAPDFRFWLMSSVIISWVGLQLHHTRKATDEAHMRQLNQVEDRLRLEDERDQSLRRFQRIFRFNPTALMVQSADTHAILEVNPAFERCFGYQSEQIVGQQARALWRDEQQWHAHSKALFEQGRTDWQRARWLCADGQTNDVLVCSNLSEDSGGMLILTTVVDGQGTD